jgi:integrase
MNTLTFDANEHPNLLESLTDARQVFADYYRKRTPNTLRRQKADLDMLRRFLWTFYVVPPSDFQRDPESWRDVNWELIEAFRRWQLDQGYAISSINVRLATVKKYAALAFRAGVISPEAHALIRTVTGYTPQEQHYIDRERAYNGQTVGKKRKPTALPPAFVHALKNDQSDTPQGRRDALLMCLLLDHGLRGAELARLTVGHLNLDHQTLMIEREKIGRIQIHKLSEDTRRALTAYWEDGDAALDPQSPLLRASTKTGLLTAGGLSERAIAKRVQKLGAALGVANLSVQDTRRSWATRAAQHGTTPAALQRAGGWVSPRTALRYIKDEEFANAGVHLE